jgi:hypothetical protein
VHPQGDLGLPAITAEVALANEEAEEEPNRQVVLNVHEAHVSLVAVSPSSCVRNIAITPEIDLWEFSTARGPMMGSSTRERRRRPVPGLGKPGITQCPAGGQDDPAIISR